MKIDLSKSRIGPRRGVLSVLALLLAAEAGLHLLGPLEGAPVLRNQEYGWVLLPDQDVLWDGVEMHINHYGFRDAEWGATSETTGPVLSGGRPSLRIAMLGDSVPFGMGVLAKDRCTEVLARALQEQAPERDVMVMNFAIPGYSFEQMEAVYAGKVRTWKPDLVVVALNDASMRPMVPTGGSSWVHQLLIQTELYRLWLERGPTRRQSSMEVSAEAQQIERLAQDLKGQPFSDTAAPYWAKMSAGLLALENEQAAFGGKLAVLLLPNLESLQDPTRPRLGTSPLLTLPSGSTAVIDPYDAFRTGLESTDGRDKTPLQQEDSLFQEHDAGHLTEHGHQRIARELARQLEAFL